MSDDVNRIVTPSSDDIDAYGGEAASEVAPGPEAALSEADEWKNKYLRAKAELSNFQKRADKDRLDSLRYGLGDFARALLPVIDDLDRVIASASENATVSNLVAGAKLTRDSFLKVLEGFQVLPIHAEGQPFDPHLHEAVMEQPSKEHPERTVLKEVARGYQLHDRVLRPARVIVSKPAAEGESGR